MDELTTLFELDNLMESLDKKMMALRNTLKMDDVVLSHVVYEVHGNSSSKVQSREVSRIGFMAGAVNSLFTIKNEEVGKTKETIKNPGYIEVDPHDYDAYEVKSLIDDVNNAKEAIQTFLKANCKASRVEGASGKQITVQYPILFEQYPMVNANMLFRKNQFRLVKGETLPCH